MNIWEKRFNSSEIIINYPEYLKINSEIISAQRNFLVNKNKEELLLDEAIVKKHLRLLDLQEEKLKISL